MSKTKTKQNRPKNASEPTPIRPSSFIAMLKKYFTPLVAGLIIGLLLGLSAFYLGTYSKNEHGHEKMLVFAGGGSVVKYLDEKYLKDIGKDTTGTYFRNNTYHNGIYLHVPSEDALILLSEEAKMPYSQNKQPFYPVCFSAKKATKESFTRKCPEDYLKENGGYIAELWVGEEALKVYVEKDTLGKWPKGLNLIAEGKITVDELKGLLMSDKYNIFKTSSQSGTYYAYRDELEKANCNLSEIDFLEYSSQTPLPRLQHPENRNRKPYIILGSEYYRPEGIEDQIHKQQNVLPLILVKGENDTIKHPIYIYFMAYRKVTADKHVVYFVPQEVRNFLDLLEFKYNKKLINENNELTIDEFDNLIVPIN